MLNPSSPAQMNLSEEDSSGSDAGSEVSLEPETDRFGFILTNGSTAGSVGPSPELVRQREAKWINIILQWDRILLKKRSKVKVQCQKGIPASLRAKGWPLLCGATNRMKQNNELYKSLDSQPGLQSWVDVIERDLDRQFPFHEMFLSKDGHGQRGLFRVLKAYTQYQPEEGYCQAQGPVAAVLLMNMPAEEAFWCLVQISEQYLPGYYSPLLEGVLFDAAMLTWVLKKTCPAAHKHLQHHGVEPLMFATDWLMCLFTRHLPFNTLLRVWDLFFCYGVRVLLQVAVVLVRRVLGRAEQRKLCQGQMETLERLRGVREEVQDEDDAFIAEVCSVTLSARDLEKQTEKELEKWRKDRPSSTFDPRGRCQGYQMAWARARQNEEERDRKEREKGNLSLPLARSASTLSLSPSLLHKRWRKGAKANAGEWEGSNRVVRHLSMGAKEDWSSSDFDFKKVQGVQEEEDIVSEGHKTETDSKLTGQSEQKELLQEPEKTDIPAEHAEETVIVKEQTDEVESKMFSEQTEGTVIVNEQTEKVETRINEKEDSQVRETEESKTLSEESEERNLCPANDQTVENTLQLPEHASHCEQEEELDTVSQSQVLEEQSHTRDKQEIEVKNTNEETEKHVAENEPTAAVVDSHTEIQRQTEADANTAVEVRVSVDSSEEQTTQADMKPEESSETENAQQLQVETVTDVSETRTETSLDPETDRDVEASTAEDQDPTTATETQRREVITERGEGAFEGGYHSTESLVETEQREESHTQTKTETDMLAQTQEKAEENAATQDELKTEITQTDSEQETKTEEETLIVSSLECVQQKENTDAADAETDAETPVAKDTVVGRNEATVSEPTQEKEEIILTVHTEAQVDSDACISDQTNAEETPAETQITEGTADSVTPSEKEETEAPNPTAEPDGTTLVQIGASEMQAPEQPTCQISTGPVEEKEKTAGEDDVFISAEPTQNPLTESKPQVQDEDSHSVKYQPELLAQISGNPSNRSSGDFCVRKSSSSRGSRLARKLSEDLFTTPQKTSQLQRIPNHPEVKHTESQSSPINPKQTATDKTLHAEVTEAATVQQEQQPQTKPPKRFGLFRRLKGEQPKNTPAHKMQVPKILIQDFSDGTGTGKPVEEEVEEKLSSRERRRRRREGERWEKEEERLKKKREKELEKERERERRKPQTRGKSFQVQKDAVSSLSVEARLSSTGSPHISNKMCRSSCRGPRS